MNPMGRVAGWVGPFVFVGGLLGNAAGALFAHKWIAEDEPNVYGPCSRGFGTCLQGGETLNLAFGLLFSGLGLASVLVGLWLIRRHRVRAARDRALLERGRQGEAVVTAATPTGMTVRLNGRVTKQSYRLELDPGDGGAPLLVKAWLPPGILPGGSVRVAYDPASRDAVLLEIFAPLSGVPRTPHARTSRDTQAPAV
jgi:hypothetical protein